MRTPRHDDVGEEDDEAFGPRLIETADVGGTEECEVLVGVDGVGGKPEFFHVGRFEHERAGAGGDELDELPLPFVGGGERFSGGGGEVVSAEVEPLDIVSAMAGEAGLTDSAHPVA